ncbi:MAG: family 78 glycoside hydrolase catalytic domain [Cyclobacteriaceae bacterium]|nr:family 78 glycoside hydrolase catalytic domain [Cyclobacteriaceae bacterium]
MKKFSLLFTVFFVSAGILLSKAPSVYDLSCEHKINPVGIDTKSPRFSWKIFAQDVDLLQTGYAIRVATSPDFSKKSIIWESGKVSDDQSVLTPYQGPALKSGTRYFWQVKIWDNKGRNSSWSKTAFWETGFMDKSEWKAKWIVPLQSEEREMPALMVRKDFDLNKKILNARAYVSSHGLYILSINGQRVGDQVMTPGWTSYEKRLQYQVYDVTTLLKEGSNTLGSMLGDGWYRGTLAWEDNWGIYGKKLGLLCQLQIQYSDGSSEVIISDESWKGTQDGPVTMNSIYDGETYDARKKIPGWDMPGFDDDPWQLVEVANHSIDNLIAMETVPVKRIEELEAVDIFRTPNGTLVVDFGQNLVGWVKLTFKGKEGTIITVRHAEVLDKHGEFYTENLRSADATMRYISRGEDIEEYEPLFTFFGFRYISVDGFPGELKPEHVKAIVVHSDMATTGSFHSSHPLINQLQKNIVWGQKGNFLDVPTDCPQRDERLGWTGDAQVFGRTAAFNMNVAAFFTKWLKDLSADQLENGIVPPVIPNVLVNNIAGSAGWADAATIIPWDLYQIYGDVQFLENQYESMQAWLRYIESQSTDNLWNKGFHFGDWLFFRPNDDVDGRAAVTDKYMIAQCFWARSTQIAMQTAELLGKKEDANIYKERLQAIKKAYIEEYMTTRGRLISGTQTAYVLALHFDMLPFELREQAALRLVDNIKSYGKHLTTGFLGTPYLCQVLTRFGHTELAFDLLLREAYPSWLYPVKMGATTIWERWDGQKPDSTFQNPGMNSFNHYAYGAIGDWMYSVVAGLDLAEPGFKKIKIHPHIDRRLPSAKASYESYYGTIESGYELKDGSLKVLVKIPHNTTAQVRLPNTSPERVIESGKPILQNRRFENARFENEDTLIELGSGSYIFSYPY